MVSARRRMALVLDMTAAGRWRRTICFAYTSPTNFGPEWDILGHCQVLAPGRTMGPSAESVDRYLGLVVPIARNRRTSLMVILRQGSALGSDRNGTPLAVELSYQGVMSFLPFFFSPKPGLSASIKARSGTGEAGPV
jgi:hypothetical protein